MAVRAWLKHAQPLLLAAAIAGTFAACDERLDAGLACPALCPPQQTALRDTTFFAVALDSSIAGFPALGAEVELFVATFGDTLQTAGVIRYDSLPRTFRHNNTAADTNIVAVDTGSSLLVRFTTTADTIGPPLTVEAYDVDLGGPDDVDPTAVSTVFTPDRLLGARTVEAAALKDTIRVPIDPQKLLAKIQADSPANRLRVGLRVGNGSRLRVLTLNTLIPVLLQFRPALGDTSVAINSVGPLNRAPSEALVQSDLADYMVVLKGPPPPPSSPQTLLRVGGLPGRRAYLRFDIPSRIIDSSNVIRATLLMTQSPNRQAPHPADTIALEASVVSAGPAITDLSRALLFLTNPARSDSIRLFPADSGQKAFEMIQLMRFWASTTENNTPRAVALRSILEGSSGSLIDFFSIDGPAATRPQLRITFIPRREGGLP
jgi:hypothetical protein